MQRKNNILNSTKKDGFAMIMAIAAVVVIATVMALSLSLSTQTAKRTTDMYLYEQAQIHTKSAAELALLQISNSTPCSLNEVNQAFGIYDFNITLQYIYTEATTCINGGATLYTTVSTPEQNGSVLMDITVSINDTTVATEPIRVFKRTIQKL